MRQSESPGRTTCTEARAGGSGAGVSVGGVQVAAGGANAGGVSGRARVDTSGGAGASATRGITGDADATGEATGDSLAVVGAHPGDTASVAVAGTVVPSAKATPRPPARNRRAAAGSARALRGSRRVAAVSTALTAVASARYAEMAAPA